MSLRATNSHLTKAPHEQAPSTYLKPIPTPGPRSDDLQDQSRDDEDSEETRAKNDARRHCL